jgi:16S rRNA pseudouridine516 synthase
MTSPKPPSLRLDRLLANLGYGSRREVLMMAREGRIQLDGEALHNIEQRVPLTAEFAARVRVDGAAIDPLPGMVLMLNKPAGVTCSHKDKGQIVYDLLPERWRRREPAISAAGRLDKDTSGLLLLTDDGAFLHKIISPKRHIAKRYVATLDQPLRGDEAAIFAAGTLMLNGEEKPLLPALLESISPLEAAVTLTEGRYHQVRRMFAAVKNHVTALRRVAIGGLTLPDDLAPGAFRALDAQQCARILSSPSAAKVDAIIPQQ